jgi:hypothetical protein
MKRLFAEIPDAAIRVAAWIVVVPVATVAVAPEWLDLPGGELETLVVLLAYLAIGIVATLWSAAALRPHLGIVVEDAFGRRSDLAFAASSTTATTYAVFGLAFVCFNVPERHLFDVPALATLGAGVGRALLVLGAMFLFIAVRSVMRRNRRETQRRVVANARADVGKGLSEALAASPPRYGGTPATW